MSALSLLKINSPEWPEEAEIKTPVTPSPNAAELFSPRYNLSRRNSTPLVTPTPSLAVRKFGRRLSVPVQVPYAQREIHYKLTTALLHNIIQFIDFDSPDEICNLERVCRQFKNAFSIKNPVVAKAWERLLQKKYGGSVLTFDERMCHLNRKHVYERRHLQIHVPIQTVNQSLLKLCTVTLRLEDIDFKTEAALIAKKLPAQLERGRIMHYLSTQRTGYPLNDIQYLEAKAVESPAYDVGLIRGLFSADENEALHSVVRYRQMLSVQNANEHIETVIRAKVVPQLIKLLRHCKSHSLKFEVSWVLTNICSGTSSNVAEVVNAGAIPFLVEALYDQSLPVDDIFIEQAIWALGNICGDSAAYCNLVLDHEPLVMLTERLLNHHDIGSLRISFLRNVCWFFSNCVRCRPRPPTWKIRRIVEVYSQTYLLQDSEVLCDTLWGLSYMCEAATLEDSQFVFKLISPVQLMQLTQNRSGMVSTPAYNCIMHCVKANPFSRTSLLKEGLLQLLASCMRNRASTSRVYKVCLDIFKSMLEAVRAEHKSLEENIRLMDQESFDALTGYVQLEADSLAEAQS